MNVLQLRVALQTPSKQLNSLLNLLLQLCIHMFKINKSHQNEILMKHHLLSFMLLQNCDLLCLVTNECMLFVQSFYIHYKNYRIDLVEFHRLVV